MAGPGKHGSSGMAQSPIAIVGLSGKFPGDASNPSKLWDLCSQGRDTWSQIPSTRFNHEAFYHPDPARNGSSNVKGGFFLKEDLSLFDAPFFGFTKAEAASLDPEQRLLLECAYETLENAGLRLEDVSGSDTGVYVGTFMNDWGEITRRDPEAIPMYQPTGSGHSMLAGRLSYFYNLKGPSMTTDTACSASFVALHNACSALRNGECKSALVGGVNSLLNHDFMSSMSSMNFLSADGRSYSYDKRASGYARGEGVACILIKPLEQALRDGDSIRAIIRGTALNQDGKTPGITHPSGTQQAALIRKVYELAGLDPNETSYVETHGTGTQVGDVIEAKAIYEAFGKTRDSNDPLLVGSIKTNVGHLEGASGLAGLVKTVMMLEKEMVLPNSGFTEPNEKIKLDEWNLKVPTELMPWKSGKAIRASINNFGYAGTNAHVIVEQAKSYLENNHLNGYAVQATNGTHPGPKMNGHSTPRPRTFVLSAFDEVSGREQAKALSSFIRDMNLDGISEDKFLSHLARTLADKRSRLPWKMAATAATIEDLSSALETSKSQHSPKTPSLGFVFTGQGAQWSGMGCQLISIPEFRMSLDLSATCLASLGAEWDVITELTRDAADSKINEATISQPLCTILQIALVDLLAAWDVAPAAVVGHSSGEIAAAYTAGLIGREDAIAAAYYRGLVSASSNKGHSSPGGMAAIPATEERVTELLSKVQNGKAAIACYNSPSIFTVSGDETAIDEVVSICKSEDISARKLVVDVAYHSSRMMPVAGKYIELMKAARKVSGAQQNGHHQTCEMFSSVSGGSVSTTIDKMGPEYWVDNLTSPVRFSEALAAMCLKTKTKTRTLRQKTPIDCLVEIGPHGSLASPIRQIMQSQARLSSISYTSILTRYRDALVTALALTGTLFEKGYSANITSANGGKLKDQDESTRLLLASLPSYPWNHQTAYWAEPRASQQYRSRKWPRHDLLGAPVNFSNELEPRWRNWVRCSELPWLRDHRVNGMIVYPAAGYVAMAIEGARQRALVNGVEIEGYELRDIRIGQALVVPESTEEVETMMTIRPFTESAKAASSATWDEFMIYSAAEDGTWSENCRGMISVRAKANPNEINGVTLRGEQQKFQSQRRQEIESHCIHSRPPKELYSNFTRIGMEYEGTFANITKASFGGGRSVGQVAYPDVEACMPVHYHSPFVVHPSLLDSTFQVAALGAFNKGAKSAMVPTFMTKVYISDAITKIPGEELSVYSEIQRLGLRDTDLSLDVFHDKHDDKTPVVAISGFTMTSLTGSLGGGFNKAAPQVCYAPRWRPDPDMLQVPQLKSLCEGLRVEGPDDETLKMLDEATFYMAEEMIQRIPKDKLTSLTEKSQNLYHSFMIVRDFVYAENAPRDISAWIKTSQAEREAVWARVESAGDEGALYLALRENLHRIILEEIDPLSVVMQDDILGRYYAADVRMSTQCHQSAAYVDLLANKNPQLKILEVGAGTGGATVPILKALGGASDDLPRFQSYDVTDLTMGFFEKLQQRTEPWNDLLKFKKLNIEQDPATQGYELGSYDLVIASNVLHATEKMDRTLDHVKALLKPGGKLILVELMKDVRLCTRIFGIFDGWWIGAGDGRVGSPLLTEELWDGLLKRTGFTGLDLAVWDLPNPDVHQGTTMISSRVSEIEPDTRSPVVVVHSDDVLDTSVVNGLLSSLRSGGDVSVQTIESMEDDDGRPAIVIAELWSSVLKAPTDTQLKAIKRVLSARDHILWVTRGAGFHSSTPDLGLVSGLLATLRVELGGCLSHLDVDPTRPLDDPAVSNAIARVYTYIQNSGGVGSESDMDFMERDGTVSIRRCEKEPGFSQAVSSMMGTLRPEMQDLVQSGRSLKLKIEKPGLLDSLYFDDDPAMDVPLKGDEVDIEVQATALNFRDVMMAMGQIETYDLGAECSGTVARVGPGVKSLRVGDRVVAQAFGTFSTFARTREIFTSKMSPEMTMEAAATLPIVYTTAVYAIKVARLDVEETVMIHCAAGGLGQALVMLCKYHGAEVYITVGTASKKQFMMEQYGISEDHIFSSRDTSFQDGIMRATNDKGIDVIFNSLSSDLLRATWQCIAPFGRFIELGKRDFAVNSRLDMAKFARNVTFAAVDLAAVIAERPEEAAVVQAEAIDMVMSGKVHAPQPVSVYPMADLEKALRTMQTGRHMGKLVITPTSTDRVRVLPKKHSRGSFRPDASYVLVGGLGGIGRSWAMRMIELGAKHLIFMSPSGDRKPAAKAAVEAMRGMNATVHVFECDVADREHLGSVLKQTASLPPIKGVFHSGSNFTSDLFMNMSLDTYLAGLRPKVYSTWNLHDLLPKDMDHFVIFSSATGIVGNTSQAAYSAASAFQDAFSDYRNNTLSLPAVSIDLGMVAGVGHVAENEDVRRSLQGQGFTSISEEECMAIIEAAVTRPSRAGQSGNVVTGLTDSSGGDSPVYRTATMSLLRQEVIRAAAASGQEVTSSKGDSGTPFRVRDLLKKATSVDEIETHVENAMLRKMCSLLMVPTSDVDIGKPMSHYGLDSLIAVEMRNWIASDIEVTVSVLQLLGNNSIQDLSKTIAHQTRVAKALSSK